MMAFTALVAAGQPIEPQHDSLLRLSWGEFAAASLNSIASIPEARREAALHAGLDAIRFPNHRLLAAQAVLPVHPYPSLLRRVLDEIDRTQDPRKALVGLTEIAKQHPTLAPLLAADSSTRPVAPELRIGAVLDPVALELLDPVRRKQLEVANRLYGGKTWTAQAILDQDGEGDGETIMPEFLQLRTIVDSEGTPIYDAWLYNVDSGSIFAAGTEDVVAEVIQCGVECSDPSLRIGLAGVIGTIPRQPAAKKKPTKKKPAAKKPAAKKPAAKKPKPRG